MSKRTLQDVASELLASTHEHKSDELLEAVRACMAWFVAEDEFLGTFDERVDMISYSEWACRKALGLPCSAEWKGVPRIVIRPTSGGGTS